MSRVTRPDPGTKGTGQLAEEGTQELLAALVRSSADAMVLETLDGIVSYWNPAAEHLYGYTAEEVLGQPVDMLIPPNRMDEAEEILRRARNGEHVAGVETVRWTKDGRRIDVSVALSPVWNDAGELIATSAIVRDITERKIAEAERARLTDDLQASEARYRTLIEQLPGAVYLLANDEDLTPLYFSPYIERITGQTPEESMISRELWLTMVHPEDRERVIAADEQQGEISDLFQVEYRHRHKNGGYVWVRDECVPLYNDAGQIVAWQGVMLDITDRVQATQTQAQLAALVESAEDAIISGTIDGTIISWNPGAERLYGYAAEEMIGQSFRRLLPDHHIDPAYEYLLAAVRAGETTAPYEGMRRRKDGSLFAASVSLSPMRDHTGAISGIASIMRDITGRKEAEAALQQALVQAEAANAAKSQFLAMMSHELRTPLQAVLGYAEFLLADPESLFSTEQREDIGYIQRGGQRMLALINQLLDLSRIEAGRLTLVTRPVDLAEILEQVRQDVAPMAMQKELHLSIELPAMRTVVIGDPERMRQILLNLVSNAVKFTEQGSVHVTAEATADGVAVRVRDTGIGIADEDLPYIFEAFRQVDSRLSRRHGGAGLGIAIAQKLAELMGGTIDVESELGHGSTFTLLMPATPPTPGSPTPHNAPLSLTDGGTRFVKRTTPLSLVPRASAGRGGWE